MSQTLSTDPARPPSHSLDQPVLGSSGPAWAQAHYILLGFLALAVVIWLLSGIYTVNAGELAVIERCGSFLRSGNPVADKASQVDLLEPGLHYHLPYPIDVVHAVPFQQTQTLQMGDFDSSPAAYEELKKSYLRRGYPKEVVDAVYDPYLITGDKNLIHGALNLTYHVVDPEAYLMCVSHVAQTAGETSADRDAVIGQIASHVLIQEVAHRKVDFILTGGVSEMQRSILSNAQEQMDRIGLGIRIDQIQLTPPKPPATVAYAFNEVLQAKQDMERKSLEAQTLAKSAITSAQAQSQSISFTAQTEKQQQILEAEGEASRFWAVYSKFKAAPDVTRANLFYDMMNKILSGAGRVMWVKPDQDTTIVIDPPEPRRPEQLPPGAQR